MKKLRLLFVLCVTLLLAACGEGTAEPTPTPTPTMTPTPTATPTPVNAAKEVLDNVQTACDSLLNWTGTGGDKIDVTKSFGYDVSMDISVNQMLLSLLELEDLKTLGLDLSMDMSSDLLSADMSFNLNEDKLLDFELFYDYEKFLFNLPKYSSQYAVLEAESTTEEALPAMDTEELLSLYRTFISDLFAAFKPQDGFVENATMEIGNYKVTGQKFTVTASVAELNTALNNFASTLQTLYPELETEITELPADEMNTFIFNVYKGENDTFAWECYPDTSADAPAGLISAENGFCIFTTTEGTTSTILCSEKISATEGILYIPSEETELALNYTLGNNSISITGPEGTFSLSSEWQFSDDYISLGFSIMTENLGISYSMISDGPNAHLDMTLISYDTELCKISADYKLRDFEEFTMPENYVAEEDWEAQADMDALASDIEALFEKYPALASLFGEEEPETGSDDVYDEPDFDPTVTYENEFMNMTGYYVDEYGNVYFEALPEEVLAIGQPSTGIFYTETTPEAELALINYATTAFANGYVDSDTFYQVSGNVASDTVESYYYEEYYCMDTANQYNIIDLYFEAVTSNFYTVDIYNASKEEAFRIANDLLVILGEEPYLNNTLDDATLSEGIMLNNFIVYGYDLGDYYYIVIY